MRKSDGAVSRPTGMTTFGTPGRTAGIKQKEKSGPFKGQKRRIKRILVLEGNFLLPFFQDVIKNLP
jgi:hypothetical protein